MFNKHETKKLSLTLLLYFHELEKEKNAWNCFTIFNELESWEECSKNLFPNIWLSLGTVGLTSTFYV